MEKLSTNDLHSLIIEAMPLALSVALIMSLIVIWLLIRHDKRRWIKTLPTEKIAKVEDGYRHLEGVTVSLFDEQMLSPFSRTPCVWYDCYIDASGYVMRVLRKLGVVSRYKGISRHERSSGWFILKDDTGFCLVDTQLAYIKPTRRNHHFIAAEDGSGHKVKSYEGLIMVGAEVTVLGHLTTITVSHFSDIEQETGLISHGFHGRHQQFNQHEHEVAEAMHKIDNNVKRRIKALIEQGSIKEIIRVVTVSNDIDEPVLIQGL